MHSSTAIRSSLALLLLLWPHNGSTCSLAPRPIWSKDPRSTSALFRVVIGGKAGYINREGKLVIAPRFNPYYVDASNGDFRDKRALVHSASGTGFIDESGRALDFGKLEFRAAFSANLAVGTVPSARGAAGQQRIIDTDGRTVAQLEAAWMGSFSEGLAFFAKNETASFKPTAPFGHPRGYVDSRGKVVIAAKFAYAGQFSEGLAAVARDGSCWVAGWGGSPFPAPSAQVQHTSCGPRPARSVTEPCRHGYIDRTGRLVIPARFELAGDFSEGRAAVRIAGKWGFIDTTGQQVVPARFDEVKPFSGGLAAVRLHGEWGYLERYGGQAISFRFDEALPFSAGLAAVKAGSHYSYIGSTGEVAAPGPYLQATQFIQGLAHVQLEKTKWAWIDPSGRAVFTYDWNQDF